MATGWNDRNDWFNPNNRNDRDSFGEHTERMKVFCNSHASDLEVRAALLEGMPILQVGHTAIQTGGAKGLINMTDWVALIPMPKVSLSQYPQN